MEYILPKYQQLDRATWIYISSLMVIALYFKFSRIWSVRNLDLLMLIAAGPGMLLVLAGGDAEHNGYLWMFVLGLVWMARLLTDSVMVRRPLLEPNLSPGGLVFMGASLLVFLMAHAVNHEVEPPDRIPLSRLERLIQRRDAHDLDDLPWRGPSYACLYALGYVPNVAVMGIPEPAEPARADHQTALEQATVRTMAILGHVSVIVALVLVGLRHFGNIRTGIAAAGLYLLLPYTAQTVWRVDHVWPAALLLWAVVGYRRPLFSGALLGLASGANYWPIFLLPLWGGFYWPRGLARFILGFAAVIVLLGTSLALVSVDAASFWTQVRALGGWSRVVSDLAEGVAPYDKNLTGFWSYFVGGAAYRIPVFVLYAALCGSFALWPPQKNLGTLLSCSAAVVLGTQFWQADSGGRYVSWYLPLVLLTVLRPNLEDRIAMSVLALNWFPRRRAGRREPAAVN